MTFAGWDEPRGFDQRGGFLELVLMSRWRLQATLPAGAVAEIGGAGFHLGPFSSNLYAFIDQTRSRS